MKKYLIIGILVLLICSGTVYAYPYGKNYYKAINLEKQGDILLQKEQYSEAIGLYITASKGLSSKELTDKITKATILEESKNNYLSGEKALDSYYYSQAKDLFSKVDESSSKYESAQRYLSWINEHEDLGEIEKILGEKDVQIEGTEYVYVPDSQDVQNEDKLNDNDSSYKFDESKYDIEIKPIPTLRPPPTYVPPKKKSQEEIDKYIDDLYAEEAIKKKELEKECESEINSLTNIYKIYVNSIKNECDKNIANRESYWNEEIEKAGNEANQADFGNSVEGFGLEKYNNKKKQRDLDISGIKRDCQYSTDNKYRDYYYDIERLAIKGCNISSRIEKIILY